MDWDPRILPLSETSEGGDHTSRMFGQTLRLDTLLPKDPETGTVTATALQVYLYATMDLMSRHAQPLSLIRLGVDQADPEYCFGSEGAKLIGRAVARCVFQETRTHDVVGRAEDVPGEQIPTFLLVCPLMTEANAALLAERLRVAMTPYATYNGRPWLSVSAGVAGMSLDILDPGALIARAAEALRSARKAGGGRIWKH